MEFKILASGSKGNAYLLKEKETILLLEAGISWQALQKKMGYKATEIDACFVTHRHGDHSKYIEHLLDHAIDVYVSSDVAQKYKIESHHRVHVYREKQPFEIGNFEIMPFKVPHDVPNYGFLIRSKETGDKAVFIIDALYCPYQFKGLTHIFYGIDFQEEIISKRVKEGKISLDLSQRIVESHGSLEACIKFLKAQDLSKVKEIVFLHCSKDNADKKEIKRVLQEVTGKLVRYE